MLPKVKNTHTNCSYTPHATEFIKPLKKYLPKFMKSHHFSFSKKLFMVKKSFNFFGKLVNFKDYPNFNMF
jgi:hypothetical protein